MTTRDLYLQHKDKKGSPRVECHRVWDAERFLAATEAAAKKEGGSVAVVTEAEYRKEKWGNKK